MYRRSVAYYLSRAHSQPCYYCCSSFSKRIIMQSILCSMSLSVVVQKERKAYRRRRDILRGVRFFVSDLFQKRPSWRGAAVAGPFCLQKKRKKEISCEKKRTAAQPAAAHGRLGQTLPCVSKRYHLRVPPLGYRKVQVE